MDERIGKLKYKKWVKVLLLVKKKNDCIVVVGFW